MVAQLTIYFSVFGGGGELCAGSGAREEGSSRANVEFSKEPAMRMLRNKIQSNGLAAASPPRLRRRSLTNHILKMRKVKEGKLNYSTHAFNEVNTEYVRYPCTECKKGLRTYFSCDPGDPLCSVCYGMDAQEHGH